jgi:hypothetical protein
MGEHWLSDIRDTYPMLKVFGETQCCLVGCDDGACFECPCCQAGWCVFGHEGLPSTLPELRDWLVVAVEYNPIARLVSLDKAQL